MISSSRCTHLLLLLPLMFSFFVMGFVDLVGIASNYAKADYQLTDTTANFLPSLVFFWFLLFSVPTSILMNKIGRKRTLLLSLCVTMAALLLPVFNKSFAGMLAAFSLLGIGNTLMQTSVTPLLSTVVSDDELSSALTFGQFVKAIASFLAPLIAAWGVHYNVFGMNWRILFVAYMLIAVLAVMVLSATPFCDEKPADTSGLRSTFALMRRPMVCGCFIGILCHVGIDVGINATAPRIFQEYEGLSLTHVGRITSFYFICRTVGCLLGTFFLSRVSNRRFFVLSVVCIMCGLIGFAGFRSETALYLCVALIGLGNSNVFSITLTQALQSYPEYKNEVSGLMIMGLFGGTIFPLAMSMASDGIGSQLGAVAVMLVAAAYLLFFAFKIQGKR